MGRRTKRRVSFGRRKRRKGGPSPKLIVAGICGLAGMGWLATRTGSDEPTPVLTTTALAEGQAPETAPAAGQAAPKAKGPVPAELAGAFASKTLGAEALIDLRRIVVEFPSSPEAPRARAALAQARSQGLAAGRTQPTDHAGHLRKLQGLTKAYLATIAPEARRALRGEAMAASRAALSWKGAPAGLVKIYKVASGDVLARIARKQGTDYRLIKGINGLKNDRIRIGQRLLIPTAPVSVLIFKRDFELVLLIGGQFLRAYDIATGKNGKTPEGRFTIGAGKLVNPDWYSPDGKLYKYGTKENILGTRWLPFVNTPEHQGFGIHGTAFPESIGTEASMGCLRLRNPEVEELYDLVPPGSQVRIVQ